MPGIDNNMNVNFQQAQQILQNEDAPLSPQDRAKLLTIVNQAHDQWVAKGRPEQFNPQLGPPKPTNPGDQGLLNDKWSGHSTTPVFNLSEIMTLLHETAKELKLANKDHRHGSRDAEQSSLKAGASKLREAAGWTLASGCVSGGMQIAGGASTMIGAGQAGSKALKGNQAGQTMNKQMVQQRSQVKQTTKEVQTQQKAFDKQSKALGKEMKNADPKTGPKGQKATEMKQQLQETKVKLDKARGENKAAKDQLEATETKHAEVTRPIQGEADRCMSKWQAGGQMLIGGGQVGGAGLEYQAKNLEADKMTDDAEAALHRNMTQDADERVKDAGEFERNCREKLSSIEEANNRAMSTANQV